MPEVEGGCARAAPGHRTVPARITDDDGTLLPFSEQGRTDPIVLATWNRTWGDGRVR